MKFSLIFLAVLACQAYAAPSKSSVLKILQTKKTANIIVDFAGSNVTALRNEVGAKSFATRTQKLNSMYNTLRTHADSTQSRTRAVLDNLQKKKAKPIVVEQLWINNKMVVYNADSETIEQLLAMDEVTDVRQERIFPLQQPIDLIIHYDGAVPQAGEQWGVAAIRAPEVHTTGNKGAGAVIGTIDTGVRATHVALKGGMRSSYNWYDPYQKTATPNDQNGHGTHTMGTIAGRANGIGVAPETTWIACKGCSTSACTEIALLTCGQWMTCPTTPDGKNADCSKAPNAVSNSWGGGQDDPWYDDIIAGWNKVNIAPLFSIGNTGPGCGTASSPGDSAGAIGVGSTTSTNGLSDFSSVGPAVGTNLMKPDIAAPGSLVYSSYHTSDNAYATMSGTSMACPHVAGLAALLYTAKPGLTVPQLKTSLIDSAQQINKTTGSCGGVPATTYPNHYVGKGRIDAVQCVNLAKLL